MSSETEIRQIICETLNIPGEQVRPDTHIRSLPNVESILILNIILHAEKRFGIEVPDDVTFRVETVGEFIGLVDDLRAAQAAQAA